MMGMVCKDILVQGKALRFYLMFMAVYVVLVFAGVFETFILGTLSVIMGMLLPMSSMAYDEQVKWDSFAAATPGGRRSIVAGKYLFTLLVLLGSGLLAFLCTGLMVLLGGTEPLSLEHVVSLAGCMGAGVLINCVSLPLMFKFGAEKSRIIYLGVFVVAFGGGTLLIKLMEDGAYLPVPPAWLVNALPVVLVLGVVILLVISFIVSLHICEKKEY